VRLLLDTHIVLWAIAEPSRLSTQFRDALLNDDSELWFSVASYWEICIKQSLGKLNLVPDWQSMMEHALVMSHIRWLPIEKHHCQKLLELPHHHRDPFDRILVAQALCEKMIFLTTDKFVNQYAVKTL